MSVCMYVSHTNLKTRRYFVHIIPCGRGNKHCPGGTGVETILNSAKFAYICVAERNFFRGSVRQ